MKKCFRSFRHAWIVLGFSTALYAADPLATWHLRNPGPTLNAIHGIAFGGGLSLTVGDRTEILASRDNGFTWAAQDTGITNLLPTYNYQSFNAIAYGNGQFVAAGSVGLVSTSADGTNWTHQLYVGGTPAYTGIAFGNGEFVAVGRNGGGNIISVSGNGTNWTQQSSGVDQALYDVIYAQGGFVAVGGNADFGGYGRVITSPDGTNWTAQLTNADLNITGIAYGGGLYVGVGQAVTVRSTNGVDWSSSFDFGLYNRRSVAYGNGLFVAVGPDASGGATGYIYTSPDGINWTGRYGGPVLEKVTFANGRFWAVGGSGSVTLVQGYTSTILESEDGITWSSVGLGYEVDSAAQGGLALANLKDVAVGNGVFVCAANNGYVYNTTAAHGIWNNQFLINGGGSRALAFGNGLFVLAHANVFDQPSISTSTNGVVWQPGNSISAQLNKLEYLNGQFVGVGENGQILTSSDGNTWATHTSGLSNALSGVAFGAGAYVAVGTDGKATRSSDGASWTNFTLAASGDLNAIAFGTGLFVTVGSGGAIYTSADGITWSLRSSGVIADLNAVTFSSGLFTTVGDSGTVLTSPDGMAWTKETQITEHDLNTVIGYAGGTMALGDLAMVLTTPNGHLWVRRNFQQAYSPPAWNSIYHNGQFIIPSDSGFAISEGGLTWRFQNIGRSFNGIVGNGNTLVAVGYGDTFIKSAVSISTNNAQTWEHMDLSDWGELYAVAYGNGTYVAVGGRPSFNTNAVIVTSTDGLDWTYRAGGTNIGFSDLVFGNGEFVATLQGSSNVMVSTDGINWSTHGTVAGAYLDGLSAINGQIIAVGNRVVASTDGITWNNKATIGGNIILVGIAYGSGYYVAVGSGGTIMTSTNLQNWMTRYTGTSQSLEGGVVYGNNSFVAAGYNGTILQSDFFTTETPVFTLGIIPPGLAANYPILTLTGPTGQNYDIRYTTNLMPGASWQLATQINLTVSPTNFRAPTFPAQARAFFRAEIPPEP